MISNSFVLWKVAVFRAKIKNKTDDITEKRSQLRWFLMVLQLFLFPGPTHLFLFLLFVVYHFLLSHTILSIIPSYTIIDFLRFFHPILSFHPIPLLIFVDLSTLYHYFAPYYYSGLQSTYTTLRALSVKQIKDWVKVTVQFEWCFQLSASNSVNMRRIPTNLYINGKLIKFSKWLQNQFFIIVFHKRIQELYFWLNAFASRGPKSLKIQFLPLLVTLLISAECAGKKCARIF